MKAVDKQGALDKTLLTRSHHLIGLENRCHNLLKRHIISNLFLRQTNWWTGKFFLNCPSVSTPKLLSFHFDFIYCIIYVGLDALSKPYANVFLPLYVPFYLTASLVLVTRQKNFYANFCIERRVFRIIGSNCLPSFKDVAKASCRKIITTEEKGPHHPLRELFLPSTNRTTRFKNCLRPPRARTSRFSNSFIKYCK